MREFFIAPIDKADLGDGWRKIIGDRQFREGVACDFGLAEEYFAILFFEDDTIEVGRGESLRPYEVLYHGDDQGEASAAFYRGISRSIGDDDEEDLS